MSEAVDSWPAAGGTTMLTNKFNFVVAILAKVVAEFAAVNAEAGEQKVEKLIEDLAR
ncbi:hypothetical protein KKB83_01685 [Patescibacteria group bacterium]|nr:hypothetical protein [Patescibacteria group bacterium]